jgi:hypothetical protein
VYLGYGRRVDDLSDAEIRSRISERYGAELAACRELLDLAVARFQSWTGRPIKRGADRITVVEAARATKSFDAVIRLCAAGFGEQAVMLNRALFEGMAVAHWVSENRREAVGLFTRHAKYTALLWRETFDALGWLDEADRKLGPSVGPKQRRELTQLFGPYGAQPWVRRSVPRLLTEVEHLWDEQGRAHLWAVHDVAHRHSNQILHSSVTAGGAATIRQTADALHMTIGPSNLLVPQALLSAYWIFGQVLSLTIDVFKLSSRETFEETFQRGIDVFSRGS